MGTSTDQIYPGDPADRSQPEGQLHLDFRGQSVSVTALSMGPDREDFGLLIRSREQSVVIVLGAEGEQALFREVFFERSSRLKAPRLAVVPGPHVPAARQR